MLQFMNRIRDRCTRLIDLLVDCLESRDTDTYKVDFGPQISNFCGCVFDIANESSQVYTGLRDLAHEANDTDQVGHGAEFGHVEVVKYMDRKKERENQQA